MGCIVNNKDDMEGKRRKASTLHNFYKCLAMTLLSLICQPSEARSELIIERNINSADRVLVENDTEKSLLYSAAFKNVDSLGYRSCDTQHGRFTVITRKDLPQVVCYFENELKTGDIG